MSSAPAAGENAAWVTLQTRLGADVLADFCRDLERLYRINPYLEVHSWQRLEAGRWHADITNHSNGRRATLELTRAESSPLAFRVTYSDGIKRSTTFAIRPDAAGSSLTITDDYSPPENMDSDAAAAQADRSLHAWGLALREYLKAEHRWSWLPLRRTWLQRVWLPMKPTSRRITRLIVLVTIAEFVFFLLVAVIYWIEQQR